MEFKANVETMLSKVSVVTVWYKVIFVTMLWKADRLGWTHKVIFTYVKRKEHLNVGLQFRSSSSLFLLLIYTSTCSDYVKFVTPGLRVSRRRHVLIAWNKMFGTEFISIFSSISIRNFIRWASLVHATYRHQTVS
jgi:hypothetical protein